MQSCLRRAPSKAVTFARTSDIWPAPPGSCSAAPTFCLPQQAAQFVESLDLLGLGYHEPSPCTTIEWSPPEKPLPIAGSQLVVSKPVRLTVSRANAIELNIIVAATQNHCTISSAGSR